jgi:hypothetical protein
LQGYYDLPTQEEIKSHRIYKFIQHSQSAILEEIQRLGWNGVTKEDISFDGRIQIHASPDIFCGINANDLRFPGNEVTQDRYISPYCERDVNLSPEENLKEHLKVLALTLPTWLRLRSAMIELVENISDENFFKNSLLYTHWFVKNQELVDMKLRHIIPFVDFDLEKEIPVIRISWWVNYSYSGGRNIHF